MESCIVFIATTMYEGADKKGKIASTAGGLTKKKQFIAEIIT